MLWIFVCCEFLADVLGLHSTMELKCAFIPIGLFLLFYLKCINSAGEPIRYKGSHGTSIRYEDKPFPSGLEIYGKPVNCQEEHVPGRFPSYTWTCRDMRVDGLRMAYGYNPAIIKDHKCTETKGFDELAEVCRSMMRGIGATQRLWVAFVTNATCDYTEENRVMLNMTADPGVGFRWDTMNAGYGWIDTLQCMAQM